MDRQRDAAREPMPEPAVLPWGIDKADVQKNSLTALTDEKLARFVIGQQKKTKYEKEREQRELKKRKADEEAAAMYAKFVASFEDEDAAQGKAFVRAGDSEVYRLQGPKKKLTEMDRLVDEMKQKQDQAPQPAPKKRREMDLLVEEIKSREPLVPVFAETTPTKAGGSFDTGDPDTTNLYVGNLAPSVTEEKLERVFGRFGRINSIKIMWPRSEDERSRRRMSGFVSFIHRREADEARVRLHDSELDGQRIVVGWGKAVKIEAHAALVSSTAPAAVSVVDTSKIVVRRPADEATRSRIDRLASFVAKDGLEFENAMRAREAGNPQYAFLSDTGSLEGIYYRWRVYSFAMGDSEAKWRGTPFQMSTNGPLWVPPPLTLVQRDRERTSRSRSRDRRSRRSSSSRSRSPSRSRSHSSRRRSRRSRSRSRHRRSRSRSSSRSSSDSDARSRRRSHSRTHSPRRREFDRPSSSGRRRSNSRSRSPPTRRHGDDPVLKKDETMLTGQQLARARDLERGREPNRLPRDKYERLMELLDGLTLERESIKQAMGCALDNSESAVEIVHTIRKRFHREDASAVQLIAYLYVASDILHNSSAAVKNASLFRSTFQECLPEILDRLRRVHRGIQGRMSALAMRDKVLSVLTAWGSWSLFPPHYLVGLNATFMRKVEEQDYLDERCGSLEKEEVGAVEEERLRKTCSNAGILSSGSVRELIARLQWLKEFTAPAPAAASKPSAPVAAPKVEKAADKAKTPSEEDDVDGEPMDDQATKEDIDGEPMDGEDLDGEPMDGEDLDGEPMDEAAAADDLDGEPLDEEEEDVDGEPLDDDEDLDGEPM